MEEETVDRVIAIATLIAVLVGMFFNTGHWRKRIVEVRKLRKTINQIAEEILSTDSVGTRYACCREIRNRIENFLLHHADLLSAEEILRLSRFCRGPLPDSTNGVTKDLAIEWLRQVRALELFKWNPTYL